MNPSQDTREKIHRFKLGDKMFAVDTETSFVFELDAIGWRALDYYGKVHRNRILHELAKEFEPREVREVLDELELLKAGGHILPEPDADPVKKEAPSKFTAVIVLSGDDGQCSETGTAFSALDFAIMRSGAVHNLVIEFVAPGGVRNHDLLKALCARAQDAESKFGKKFAFRLVVSRLKAKVRKNDPLGQHDIGFSVDFKDCDDIEKLMARLSADRVEDGVGLKRVARALPKRTMSGARCVATIRPLECDLAGAVEGLVEAGFRDIVIETHHFYLQDRGLDLDAARQAFKVLAQSYAKSLLEGRIYRLDPFAANFKKILNGERTLRRCGAVVDRIAFSPQGGIYPCAVLAETGTASLGSLGEDGFDAELARQFGSLSTKDRTQCNLCWARNFCAAGCPAAALKQTGDLGEPWKEQCALERFLMELSVVTFNTLADAGFVMSATWSPAAAIGAARAVRTGSMRVRPVRAADFPILSEWETRNLNTYSLKDALGPKSAYEREKESEKSEQTVREFMMLDRDNQPLGVVRLRPNVPWRNAEIAILFSDPELLAKKSTRTAARTMLRNLFKVQGLNRLFAYSMVSEPEYNELYEAIGFQEEGTIRDCIWHRGTFHDVKVFGLLADEAGKD